MARRKSEVYWEERSVEAKLAGIKDTEAYAKRLAKAYEDAARAMDDELAKWYGRYAKAEGITIEQARAMIRGSDFSAFRRDVQEYINMGRTLPYSDEWAEELERLSSEYHVTRYEALIAQLRQRIEMIYAMQKGNLDDVLANIYSDQCHRMAFDLQNFTGVYTHFEAVSTDAAKLVLSHPWATDGKIYSTRIWEHQKKLIGEVEQILSRGLLTGDSYDNMAKQLQKAMQTSAFNANRLITTEAAYFQECARENTMDALGVDKRQIFATLDTKTCEHCGRLDLKVIDKADCTPGVTVPPFHVFCRCTHGPYYDDEFSRQFDKRAYRDPETGKTMTAEMTSYEAWKEKYLKSSVDSEENGLITNQYHGRIKMDLQLFGSGKDRADKYAKNWKQVSLSETIEKFEADGKPYKNDNGKIIYPSTKNHIQIVYDVLGDYFRIEDKTKTGKRRYLSIDGKDVKNITENGKTRGRTPDEYYRITHFKNKDGQKNE